MKRGTLWAAVLTLIGTGAVITTACVADPDLGSSGGTDASSDGNSGGGDGSNPNGDSAVINAPPKEAPLAVTFVDRDPAQGKLAGVVVVTPPASNADITGYNLYWGQSPTGKLNTSPFGTLTPSNIAYTFAAGATPPAGATNILAYATNSFGEGPVVASKGRIDNYPIVTNFSGIGSDIYPTGPMVLDSALGRTATPCSGAVVICSLDGTSCNATPQYPFGTIAVSGAAIDAPSHTVQMVGALNTTQIYAASCNIADAGCSGNPSTLGATDGGGSSTPLEVVDTNAQKLMVIGLRAGASPELFRCDFDAGNCVTSSITSAPANSTQSALLDSDAGGMFIASLSASSSAPQLYRCAVDGTSCSSTFVGDAGGGGTQSPFAIEHTDRKLLFASPVDSLFMTCSLDGSSCTKTPFATAPSAILVALADDNNSRAIFVYLTAAGEHPTLVHCNVDGSNCTTVDLVPSSSHNWAGLSAVIDSSGVIQILSAEEVTPSDIELRTININSW